MASTPFLNLKASSVLLAFVATGLLSGCTTMQRSSILENKELPNSGGEMSASLWSDIENERKDIAIGKRQKFLWWLPNIAHKDHFEVNMGRDEAKARRFSRYGLGIPMWDLVLENSWAEHRYVKGQAEPVGSVHVRRNPFWATSWSDGDPGSDVEAKVSGIPLLWESGHERAGEWVFDETISESRIERDMKYWQTLWNIGPASWTYSDKQTLEDGEYSSNERYFFPLMLGRGLGMALYSDQSINETFPDTTYQRRSSGPLRGYPLYYQERLITTETAPDATVSVEDKYLKIILGGILWYNRKVEENGEIVEAARGPLWSLFGTGYNKGEKVTYIFRIPVGGSKDKAAEAPVAE